MQQRIQRGSGAALRPIAARAGERVSKRAANQQRHRQEDEPGQLAVEIKERPDHDHNLQNRDHALLDAVDQHPLDRVHILDHARDEVAGRAIIKPAQRQPLDVPKEVAPQIEDHLLLEAVVEQNPQPVEHVLQEKREQRETDHREEQIRPMTRDHVVDEELRHRREDDDHERAHDRATQRARGHPRDSV